MLVEVTAQHAKETQTISRHLDISLNELINRQQLRLAELLERQQRGDTSQPLAANLKQTEDRIDELNARLENRRAELERERECMIGDLQHVARAWVLPHPDRQSPAIAPMVSDPEIEKIAVRAAIEHEEAEGRVVESVENDNRGFDLISRKPHPEDPKTAIDVRFIEVKGRAHTGEIALTANEYNTAKRLRRDYWLYVVCHCAAQPSLNFSGPHGDYDRLKVPEGTFGLITPAVEAQLNARQKQIMVEVQESGFVTSGWCQKRLKVVRDTANRDRAGLVELGLLESLGKGRATRYALKSRAS